MDLEIRENRILARLIAREKLDIISTKGSFVVELKDPRTKYAD